MSTTATQPRPEHPRPQFERKRWMNLNGTWSTCFDFGKSGSHPGRELFKSQGFEQPITVPFCPESTLSGLGHVDFIDAMWYHRKLEIPAAWQGQRILLHFGAVDYEAQLYIDGISIGTHFGGTSSFSFDLTPHVRTGATHDLVVRIHDETHGKSGQPRGKQCAHYKSAGCSYTRTTGIWQTVWLEAVSPWGLKDCQIVPDLDGARFIFTPAFHARKRGLQFRVTITDNGTAVAAATAPAADAAPLSLALAAPKTWSPESAFLYDFLLEVVDADGTVVDSVKSYGGLRKIHVEGDRLWLNNQPVYLRLVLDQGFYPDGIWTAPSDAALKRDIELAMQAGFNGARLHQKVFEERFHYWADQLGYLTWGESSSWGCDVNDRISARNFLPEWREIVVRDRNHPSIIAWSPFNETGQVSDELQHHRLHIDAYELTKALDPTRPVNDASGYIHVRTDLWTVHHYERGEALLYCLDPQNAEGVFHRWPQWEAKYGGQPYINDEFGGLKWIPPDRKPHADNTWGYGNDLKDVAEFYNLLDEAVAIMLQLPRLSGYCYTQLTDVEQEQNGIFNYDRTAKFDMARIAAIFRKVPPAFS